MTDSVTALDHAIAGKPVYRRDFRKADGRMLRLYGMEEHGGEPLREAAEDLPKGGELRYHPVRQEWNVYAAHRQNRTFKPAAAEDPLAPSRPGRAATEIPFADFELATFDNKFAALHPEATDARDLPGIESEPARGACEVVVYSPEATGSLATIGQERRRLLLAAWMDRYTDLFASGAHYVMPFENRGDAVGVTLHHPHGQIYAFGRTPLILEREAEAFAAGYDLAGEIAAAMPEYGVTEAGGVAAFAPRFARFPFECWIAPRTRRAGPWDMTEEECDGFAFLLGDITRRYDSLFGTDTPYMLALHSAPGGDARNYHFTAQFFPLLRAPGRIKYLASVEQHSGMFTVDVMPEDAARALREVAE